MKSAQPFYRILMKGDEKFEYKAMKELFGCIACIKEILAAEKNLVQSIKPKSNHTGLFP